MKRGLKNMTVMHFSKRWKKNLYPICPSYNIFLNLEGVTLSLRIERTASGPVLRVNGEQSRKQASVATETSSDSEFDYATYEYDDKIKVIRRYEIPPDEQILCSGQTRVSCKPESSTFKMFLSP